MKQIEILTPILPESIANATVVAWHKKVGDRVQQDEVLAEIETDKVVLEVVALSDGILNVIEQGIGSQVTSQQVLGTLEVAESSAKEVKTTEPKVEIPKFEAPKIDTPKVEIPKVELSKSETIKSAELITDMPNSALASTPISIPQVEKNSSTNSNDEFSSSLFLNKNEFPLAEAKKEIKVENSLSEEVKTEEIKIETTSATTENLDSQAKLKVELMTEPSFMTQEQTASLMFISSATSKENLEECFLSPSARRALAKQSFEQLEQQALQGEAEQELINANTLNEKTSLEFGGLLSSAELLTQGPVKTKTEAVQTEEAPVEGVSVVETKTTEIPAKETTEVKAVAETEVVVEEQPQAMEELVAKSTTETTMKTTMETSTESTTKSSTEPSIDKTSTEFGGLNKASTPNTVEVPVVEIKTLEQVVEAKSSLASLSETRQPMSNLRKFLAKRLVEVKNQTAMLTTFNEVDMSPIQNLRHQYGEKFAEKYGIRLGLMSFYVKACVEALKRYPILNARIEGEEIVYSNEYHISVAVSTPRGLVTPVIRNADQKTMAEIELEIKEFAHKGRNGKLILDELQGGTFTITNGGVFGSLMSTPIINPPQSGILGMHAIKERPIAVNGEVVIRPMMYLALSYDHRLIDGKDSVGFLVTVKEILEDPTRILL